MSADDQSLPADDATLAAPDQHKIIFENKSVRVLRTTLARGDRTPLHAHPWPMTIYVQNWSDIAQYDAEGRVAFDTRSMASKPLSGTASWVAPVPLHSTQNVGDGDLLVISVEMKRV